METLVKRSDKVAFFGVREDGEARSYYRMTGFTDISVSKNPKEYTRQYVDEEFEQTDIVGYSPSMSYGFDQYKGNAVHEDIVQITDKELTGTEAVRSIIVVDKSQTMAGGGFKAVKRDFAIIPDSEGGSMDAYTYSGNLKVKGDKVFGVATLSDDETTATFVSDGKGETETP